ncbi:Xanthine dehydrogenase/oxidase [Holothuria leucospilota]|uniref:xanthine dehydrogenase n=1 Tax=Holothuria leucospilota TaxID=206669 RepID=A0A9Q1HI68_HOLLE|nr:Xanthine dehydrogenase/oxidase [Holothuria leucospilota]
MGDNSTIQKDVLTFFCNGKKITDPDVNPSVTLSSYLRSKLHLRGTKIGCDEGGCGACTVMVSAIDEETRCVSHVAVNSCLMPVCSVHGMAVTTVEGIGSTTTKLHPVQERIAKAHGSQCGFCTPGFVMSMFTLLRNNPRPTMEEIHEALEGNLCRCTGYRPIIEGFRSFSEGCCGGDNKQGCCKQPIDNMDNKIPKMSASLFRCQEFEPHDPTQDVIFPPELMMRNRRGKRDIVFKSDRLKWFQPQTMERLLNLKAIYPAAKLVIGNSEIGVEIKFKNQDYPVIINARHIPELNRVECRNDGVYTGASVTLTVLKKFLKRQIKDLTNHQTRPLQAIVEMLKCFAGVQIRNTASIGGNIVTASPISDLNPLLMAAGASLDIISVKGSRTVKFDENFFVGYRKTTLKPAEVLAGIFIPFTREDEYFYGFKQAQRKEDDISIVNAGMMVEFKENSNIVKEMRLAFGGMAATTIMAKKTMAKLKERPWNNELMTLACEALLEDLPLVPGSPGGMESYRQSLALSFFFKFYLKVLQNLAERKVSQLDPIPSEWRSAIDDLTCNPFKSTQLFQENPVNRGNQDPVGRPMVFSSALQQATGEARYVGDIPKIEGELSLALVYSTKAHANIRFIKVDKAVSSDGVFDVITAKDIPGENNLGFIKNSEECLASSKVYCVGQPVAAVLATDPDIARSAAKLVEVDYEELEPILTIEEAIAKESFLAETPISVNKGDVDSVFKECDHVLDGEMKIGAQEHFYLESQGCLVIPKGEHQEMEIITSTQNVTFNQESAAQVLGIPSNKIVVKTKRLGGGFGGKEFRPGLYSNIAAVAAVKSGRPVRLILERYEDMVSSGTRHSYLAKYKIGFSTEGKILAADLRYYSNAGHSPDLSHTVILSTLSKCDNGYRLPNCRVTGYCCKTNLPSRTAFRAFGAPQGMIVTETWISDIAKVCGISQEKVREINLYKEGDVTHLNETLHNVTLSRCWEECLTKSNFNARRKDLYNFNRQNRWKKRGLSIIPTKYGVGFIGKGGHLNQAGALVHVYTDGTVLLTHGGIEMGQGLYIKMIQVASHTLGIPIEKIHTSETSTDKVPNSSPTAASTGSDLNGMAVKNACEKILNRLKPMKDKHPGGTWEEWVQEAYLARINLSATGFYRAETLHYDMEKNEGALFYYYCYGAAASEVEIDCLTGDHVVLRTDIVMDVGDSINPAVDIGQVEGAFTQGYGLFLLEDYRTSPKGHLLTVGPGAYKLPSIGNTPYEFNVFLLHDASNPRNICSSKQAVGEPPLFLSASVFFAVKDAISAARADASLPLLFRLDTPAVPERVRMACQDHLTDMVKEPSPGTYVPFFIRP